jgi:hypothetical protein
MTTGRCSVVRCRKLATVVHEVGKGLRVRRYEVCDDHDADYFGRGRFLSAEQLERIRRDLVPAAIR